MTISALIGIILLAGIVIWISYWVAVGVRKTRQFSQAAFGTTDLVKGLKNQADVLAETPKSVASMTKLMEPLIAKDFTDFSWPQFKAKAENMLKQTLTAISTGDSGRLPHDTVEELRRQIEHQIYSNQENGITEHYENIQIHQTEITNYKKADGHCVIIIQSAVGYLFYKEQGGKVIAGSKERKTQSKFNLELAYIQDEGVFGYDNAKSVNCPHCGAPIMNIGTMYCEYCGSGILAVNNAKVWSLHKIYEVDYNHV